MKDCQVFALQGLSRMDAIKEAGFPFVRHALQQLTVRRNSGFFVPLLWCDLDVASHHDAVKLFPGASVVPGASKLDCIAMVQPGLGPITLAAMEGTPFRLFTLE